MARNNGSLVGRLDGCGSAVGVGAGVGVGVGIDIGVDSYQLDIWPILRACVRAHTHTYTLQY